MKLPLKYNGLSYTDSGGRYMEILDADGVEILGEYVAISGDEAKQIIKACNMFPELVEALEGLLNILEFEGHAYRPKIETAKELLAKIKET